MEAAIIKAMISGSLPSINAAYSNPLVRKLKINGRCVKRPFCLSPKMSEALADLKERSFIPQPFRNIQELWRALDWPEPKAASHSYWRLTPCKAGAHYALPTINGFLVATDGVQCIIIRADSKAFLSHVDAFDFVEKLELKVQDFDSYEGKKVRKVVKSPRRSKVDILEFV